MSSDYFKGIDNSEFNKDQLIIIEQGRDLGLNQEQESVYARSEFSWEQMWEIQQGLLDGLTKEQVSIFADPALDYKIMCEKRKELERLLGLSEKDDMLLEDSNVRSVLDILKNNGMEREANDYLSVLCNVDTLYNMINQQEIEILSLEYELKKQQNKGIIRQAADLLEAAKRDIHSLKKSVGELKDNIKDGAKLLVQTFKSYGKTAFCKAAEGVFHGIKDAFCILQNKNRRDFEKTDERINKLSYLCKEASAAQTHFKNIGRILIGKSAKTVEQDRNISFILKPTLNFFEKQSKRLNHFNHIYEKCFNTLDDLEKSFGKSARENKKSLDNLISEGFSKNKKSKENNKQKEPDRNR